MNKSELISIVIPVFNEAGALDELIRRCLDTCRERFSRFEIILVDDGSTDGSTDMICNAAGQHPGARARDADPEAPGGGERC